MLLADLDRLYDELEADDRLLPPAFGRAKVRITVELDAAGGCVGVTDTGRDAPTAIVPQLTRSGSRPPPIPVVDNAKFVFAAPDTPEEDAQKKSLERHAEYLTRLDECIAACRDPTLNEQLQSVRRFVGDPTDARRHLELGGVDFGFDSKGESLASRALTRFRVEGVDPTGHPEFRSWWASAVFAELSSEREGVCQVSGHIEPLAKKLPKVNVAGPASYKKLISANFAAAERYNASQSSGAGLSVGAAVRTHQALNWLLSDSSHHQRIGDLTYAWWVDGDTEYDPLQGLMGPDPETVLSLLASPRSGRQGVSASSVFRMVRSR